MIVGPAWCETFCLISSLDWKIYVFTWRLFRSTRPWQDCQGVNCQVFQSIKPGKFNYLNRTFELWTMTLLAIKVWCDVRRLGGRNWFEYHDWNCLCYSFKRSEWFNIQYWRTFQYIICNAQSKYEDKFVTSCITVRPPVLNRFKHQN